MWHPDYGETTERRLVAVNLSYDTSIVYAAEVYNVHPETIVKWRRRVKESEDVAV
jgi:transposase-like protein